jgi:hypothetical protein
MGVIKETANWESSIYQIEPTDPVLAGENGPANTQARQLANRTAWLKAQDDAKTAEISTARGTYGSLNERITALQQSRKYGTFNFDPRIGATIVHGMNRTDYVVNVDALEAATGTLGEVYVDIGPNSFTVFNTGSFSGEGCYTIIA